MDWQGLMLSSRGRLGRRDFWIAWGILFGASLVLGLIPVLGWIVVIALIYPTICVAVKRLHDMGRPGWLALLPYGVLAVGMLISGIGMAASTAGGSLGGLGLSLLVMMVGIAACIGFALWVGLSQGEDGANAYGTPPMPVFGAGTPPTTV